MMTPDNFNAIWVALLSALGGGGGIKFLEFFLNRSKDKDDIATTLRNELRTQVGDLQKRLDKSDEELDSWKEKYYTLLNKAVTEGKIKPDEHTFE